MTRWQKQVRENSMKIAALDEPKKDSREAEAILGKCELQRGPRAPGESKKFCYCVKWKGGETTWEYGFILKKTQPQLLANYHEQCRQKMLAGNPKPVKKTANQVTCDLLNR